MLLAMTRMFRNVVRGFSLVHDPEGSRYKRKACLETTEKGACLAMTKKGACLAMTKSPPTTISLSYFKLSLYNMANKAEWIRRR